MRFPVGFLTFAGPAATAGRQRVCWIISLLLLAGGLGACSAAKPAYGRPPELNYWHSPLQQLPGDVNATGAAEPSTTFAAG